MPNRFPLKHTHSRVGFFLWNTYDVISLYFHTVFLLHPALCLCLASWSSNEAFSPTSPFSSWNLPQEITMAVTSARPPQAEPSPLLPSYLCLASSFVSVSLPRCVRVCACALIIFMLSKQGFSCVSCLSSCAENSD